jgi:hypothetical protein
MIVVWRLLTSAHWAQVLGTGTAAEANLAIGVLTMRSDVFRWYSGCGRTHPHRQLTQLADVTPATLGTASEKQLSTKGAETYGLVLFMIDRLHKYKLDTGDDGARLWLAGKCCPTWSTSCRTVVSF